MGRRGRQKGTNQGKGGPMARSESHAVGVRICLLLSSAIRGRLGVIISPAPCAWPSLLLCQPLPSPSYCELARSRILRS